MPENGHTVMFVHGCTRPRFGLSLLRSYQSTAALDVRGSIRTSLRFGLSFVRSCQSAAPVDVPAMPRHWGPARERLLNSMRPQLTFEGWHAQEREVAAKAAASGIKVLSLSDGELRAVAARLASQGIQRCAHSALAVRIAAEADAVALAWFERQYARLLVDLIQQRTDFWGVGRSRAAAECATPVAARVLTAACAAELRSTGMCVIDGALSVAEVVAARAELDRMHSAGLLTSVELQERSNVRNDKVGWLETRALASSPALAPAVALLRGVAAEVQRHAGGSIALAVPHLVQAAYYDGHAGRPSFYHRHLDCSDPEANPRRLTAILYLNPAWDVRRDGGALRAYLPDGSIHLVAPEGGRLLLFNSCDVPHEVLPSLAPRVAVTLWAFAEGWVPAADQI